MKKSLLSFMTVALSAFALSAETVEWDLWGTNDAYDLTREQFQSTISNNDLVTTMQREIQLKQGGVEITFSHKSDEFCGDKAGWAFVATNMRQTTYNGPLRGIYGTSNYSATNAYRQWIEISVAGVNAKVTGVTLWVYNGVTMLTEINFGGKTVTGSADGSMRNALKYTWSEKADNLEANNVVVWTPAASATTAGSYFSKIVVEYENVAAENQSPNDLAFATNEVLGIQGAGKAVDVPELTNPHNLPLTWSSTNENVATVDPETGKITMVAPGETRIVATFEGNDEYVQGSISFLLNVIGSANDCKELFTLAPNPGDRVWVNFPMIVNYFNNASGAEYVSDMYGNGALVRAEKEVSQSGESSTELISYKVGDVIPQGWIVTNTPEGNSTWTKWMGIAEASTETAEVNYPVVTDITHDDAYRTLVIKNLTVTEPGIGDDPYYGTSSTGNSVTLQNSFGIGVPEGTWDVTGIVQYSKRTTGSQEFFYFMPISYTEPAKLVFPESFDVTADSEDVVIDQYFDDIDMDCYTFEVSGTTTNETVTLSFNLPEGWDGLIGTQQVFGAMSDKKRINASKWQSIEDIRAQFGEEVVEGKELTFETDKVVMGNFFLYSGDQVDVANPLLIAVQVKKVEAPAPVDPEFPSDINITADTETVTIEKIEDFDVPAYQVSGATLNDKVTLTFEVPEGWDGFIGTIMSNGAMKRAIEWESLETMEQAFGEENVMKGNVFEFPTDTNAMCNFFLYKGDQVDVSDGIVLAVAVNKIAFPEEFNITLSSVGMTVTQEIDEDSCTIIVGGEAATDTVRVTFAVPEGWDGYLVQKMVGGEADPMRRVAGEEEESMWAPADILIDMFGMEKTNVLEFNTNGELQVAGMMLYTGNYAYGKNINVEANVKYNKDVHVEAIEANEAAARYFNLQGVEVANPQNGIFVKVQNGKATKVTLN